jgi:hypothetical protein
MALYCFSVVSIRKGQMRYFFLKDDEPPPDGNTVPGAYLFMRRDKPDRILQILFHFL